MMDWDKRREEYLFLKTGAVFLNTGSSGLKAGEVWDAAADYEVAVESFGPCGPAFEAKVHPVVAETRRLAAELVGASEGEAALVANTSHALSVAVNSLRWRAGDKLLVSRAEYISGALACTLVAERHGVERVAFDHAPDHSFDMDRFAAALATPGLRLVLVSHVHYGTGEILPVAEICRAARARGILTLVDGAQAAGAFPVDVRALGCDFYVYPAHKWLGSLEGAGALVVRRELIPDLLPLEIGYDSVARFRPDDPLALHPDARRFECASLPYPSVYAFRAALARALATGPAAIRDRIAALAAHFWRGAAALPDLEPVTPAPARGTTGLASFNLAGRPPAEVVAALLKRRIITRVIPQPACVRASFHPANSTAEIDALIAALGRP